MAELTTERLRGLLDEIDQEAKDAESKSEVEQLRAELAEVREIAERSQLSDEDRAALARIRERLDTADDRIDDAGNGGKPRGKKPPAAGDDKSKRTRPGRKRGHVYQDGPGEPGYVYDGDDEPDEVELPDDESGEGGGE